MKRGKSFIRVLLTVVMLLCSMCFVACRQGNAGGNGNGTYYLYENEQLDKSSFIKLGGGKWSDDDKENGTYSISGDTVTIYIEIEGQKEEFAKGTLKDGVLTLTIMGKTVVYCQEGKTPPKIDNPSEPDKPSDSDKPSESDKPSDPDKPSAPADQAIYRGNEGNPYYELMSVRSRDITNIAINENCKIIADNAFEYCSGLTHLTIPGSVTSIGDYAFRGCSRLMSAKIGSSVTSIGGLAFSGCGRLTNITLPDSVISIGDLAFSDCSGLTSVTIPGSVTSISRYAFSGCSGLTSVNIPDSVTSISRYAINSVRDFRKTQQKTPNNIENSLQMIA